MARLVDNPLQVSGIREKCMDFAIRIFEAKGKDLVGTPSGLADEAVNMARKFEEYINSRT